MKKKVIVWILAGMMLVSSFGVQAESPGDAAPAETAGEQEGAAAPTADDAAGAGQPGEKPEGDAQPEGGAGQPGEKPEGDAAQPDGDAQPEGGAGQPGKKPQVGADQPGDGAAQPEGGAGQPEEKPANSDAQVSEEGEVTEPITKEDRPYLSLGANLSEEQRATVLELLGINPAELSEYDVIYTTIDEEYRYLGAYLSSDIIGTGSLSSVLVVKRDPGNGINITTKNISHCTIGMYKNALITAGLTDADIIVAAPFPVSGTAALVGAMKAYAVMTGEEVSEESMDAALNELVLTGDLAESIGDSKQVEEFIAYLKQQIVENHLETEEEIRAAIEEACDKLDIVLSESEIQQVISLLQKIGSLDLDIDSIMNQAKDLYDRIAGYAEENGFWDKIVAFFNAIIDFFKNLFR